MERRIHVRRVGKQGGIALFHTLAVVVVGGLAAAWALRAPGVGFRPGLAGVLDRALLGIHGLQERGLQVRLALLGKMTVYTKQLDMVMFSDAAAQHFAREFIAGGYHLAL